MKIIPCAIDATLSPMSAVAFSSFISSLEMMRGVPVSTVREYGIYIGPIGVKCELS
jgi:hypothetical protein